MTLGVAIATFNGAAQQTTGINVRGKYNVTLKADGSGAGTVKLERSFDRRLVANDAAATWNVVSRDTAGNEASYVLTANQSVGIVGEEPETDIFYRLNCTAHTAGTIAARLSF